MAGDTVLIQSHRKLAKQLNHQPPVQKSYKRCFPCTRRRPWTHPDSGLPNQRLQHFGPVLHKQTIPDQQINTDPRHQRPPCLLHQLQHHCNSTQASKVENLHVGQGRHTKNQRDV